MNIQRIEIIPEIILLVFDNQYDITSTFLRFQEHYESPEFAGKIFTLEEYKNWYTKEMGSFTYYTDWNGFNIPSYILRPFKTGKFGILSDRENLLLDLLDYHEEPFYVIGVHKENLRGFEKTLKHEIAHGLFYTDKDYKDKVLRLLEGRQLNGLKKFLRESGGYNESVILDECHAYHISGSKKIDDVLDSDLKESLLELYNQKLRDKEIVIKKIVDKLL